MKIIHNRPGIDSQFAIKFLNWLSGRTTSLIQASFGDRINPETLWDITTIICCAGKANQCIPLPCVPLVTLLLCKALFCVLRSEGDIVQHYLQVLTTLICCLHRCLHSRLFRNNYQRIVTIFFNSSRYCLPSHCLFVANL